MTFEINLDIPTLLAEYETRLETLQELSLNIDKLNKRDQEFAESLCSGFATSKGLSPRQWFWVETLHYRTTAQEEIEGTFKPILVMFRLAASNGDLKKPKIRLLTDNNRFVLCVFNPEIDSKVEVYVDGWAGHGHRKYAGRIEAGKIVPYMADRMTPDVVQVLQELSRDPAQCMKAMAARLGMCGFCGSHLTDEPSKAAGYGPVCAQNYHLPWGDRSNARVELPELFNDL
jgi:hypothetical protein